MFYQMKDLKDMKNSFYFMKVSQMVDICVKNIS